MGYSWAGPEGLLLRAAIPRAKARGFYLKNTRKSFDKLRAGFRLRAFPPQRTKTACAGDPGFAVLRSG